MYKPVSVSLSGPAFSFLLYENTKSRYMQEGFLVGEIVHKETKTITDHDQQQINNFTTIKINSVIPCPQFNYFYNNVGRINQQKIEQFLGNQFTKVIAWYKFRKTASFKFTLREKAIHKQLGELFGVSHDLFTCCLLIAECSENNSTHMYQQTFVRHNHGYDRIPVHITNLSEPNNTYKSSEASSDTFNKIIHGLKFDTKVTQGLVVITEIQNALQDHIDCVVKDLSDAEMQLFELENDIHKLLEAKKKLFDECNSVNAGDIQRKSEDNESSLDLISFENDAPTFEKKSVRGRSRGRGKRKCAVTESKVSPSSRKKH